MPDTKFNYIDSDKAFKHGLDIQREQFKEAKYNNDYDAMCDALENIKSEIKGEVLKRAKGNKKIVRIENNIKWYRTLEERFIVNTEEGKKVVFPPNIHNKVNYNLTVTYELLIIELRQLKLL